MQGRIENQIKTEESIRIKLEAMPEFLRRYYMSLMSKSHMTKLRYINNVIRFLNYYSNNNIESLTITDINQCDAFVIQSFLESIKYHEKDGKMIQISNELVHGIDSSLSSFFAFMVRSRLIDQNPFSTGQIERPRLQEKEIVFLTPEEVKKVEEQILNNGTARQEEWKLRDLLLFRIPAITGIRVTALSEINMKDINFKNSSIRVTEKGNITKDIYIDKKTKDYILEWIRQRTQLMKGWDKCDALFISNQRTRMSVRSIERVVEKYSATITTKHITPHKLRSTCGTNLYQKKKDIYLVAEVLGHKSTAPTKRYTKVFDTDKIDAINSIASMYD